MWGLPPAVPALRLVRLVWARLFAVPASRSFHLLIPPHPPMLSAPLHWQTLSCVPCTQQRRHVSRGGVWWMGRGGGGHLIPPEGMHPICTRPPSVGIALRGALRQESPVNAMQQSWSVAEGSEGVRVRVTELKGGVLLPVHPIIRALGYALAPLAAAGKQAATNAATGTRVSRPAPNNSQTLTLTLNPPLGFPRPPEGSWDPQQPSWGPPCSLECAVSAHIAPGAQPGRNGPGLDRPAPGTGT